MRILITGATGFIGSHLVVSLLNAKHTIAILKRKSSGLKSLESLQERINILAVDTYYDINTGIKQFMPDMVIHLAALYINKHSPENIANLINTNITFGTQVLEAMMENRVMQFLNIGTRWQHIGNKRYCPANFYAATKAAFKDMLVYYEVQGIKHKTIELCDTFGAGDNRKKIMDILISACQNNDVVELTPGEQILDLSYVDDICEFITSNISAAGFFDNKTISLSGTTIRLRELGMMIEKAFKTSGSFKWGAKSYRDNEVMNPPIYYKKNQLNKDSLEKYIKNMARILGYGKK
ncbi:NAD-dependent epimerase/dehydratase family protein [Treponema primitia]|uniref:NAD-dependent epimerase/dehydratase family protein n=1 Tax=Treponema primitia TaxID=88058 RepID=UPI00025555FE|nr:NAD-dependent epimerase/dehydratase family protein [Treponema primitia]